MATDADIDMADLASLDAPASSASTAAPSVRFHPKVKGKPKPKPKTKPEPKAKPNPESKPESGPHAAAATLPEGGVDAMETDRVCAGEGSEVRDLEDADFVVREIGVYFTPKPFDKDTKLHIMQYPLRSCWRPYELSEVCQEVRVKPESSMVEVDLEIDTESDNYDPEVSASLRLTKRTLSSSEAAADVADYAVGVLRGNLVHLNHLDAVMQLRPSVSRLISGALHSRQPLQQLKTNGGVGGQIVQSVIKANARSDGSKDCTEEPEPWIPLTYEPSGSDVASKYCAEMMSSEGRPIDFTMSTQDYAMSLGPGGPTGSKHINRCQLKREMLLLPLEVRLKKWFTEVSQVNRFDALMHLAPACSEEDVLKILLAYADLVRGLWVCKSSLLYDDGHASKRDKIMLAFTKGESIPVNYVDRLIRDDRTRNMILNPLGKRREKLKDYKFIVAADSSFIKRYSRVVKEQKNAWSVREATMSDPLETCSATEQRKPKNSTRSNSNIPGKGHVPVIGKARDGLVQGSENHVRSVLDSVFTANKVRSFPAVVRDLRHLAVKYASDRKNGARFQALSNAAQTCVSLSRKELDASIRLVAVPVHDLYVQMTEEKATLRNVLIKLFRGKDSNGTLEKQEILDCALKLLKRKISEKEYHQAVTEICISNEDGHLVLKNGEMP